MPDCEGEAAGAILKEAGLRRTPGRVAVVNALLEACRPLTREEISRSLPAQGPHMVSVYRCLKALWEAGVVHQVDTEGRARQFAMSGRGQEELHPHFICRRCGRAQCLEDVSLPPIPAPGRGYLVERKEVYLKGLCPDCSRQIWRRQSGDRFGW